MGKEGSATKGMQGFDFSDRLAELKRRGSAVLVTGADIGEAHTDLCWRLFGDSLAEPRRRVLVITNGTGTLDARLPTGTGEASDTTVIPASTTRSVQTAATPPRGAQVVEPAGASLGHLGIAITEAIERIQRDHAPLEAAELRLGVESLAPLLDAHGEEQVFEFLAVATHYLQEVDALGHFHLPFHRDADVARLLTPLFDVVVEVRVREGQPRQRWHLDDGAITSRWLPL